MLPVYAGRAPGALRSGAAVEAFDDDGRPLIGEVGELVITEPMPSMPLFFWNDPDGERYRESYFETYPGRLAPRRLDQDQRARRRVIYGRSDSTINRQGVRMGTSELYSAVEGVPEVLDSLVIDVPTADGADSTMWLFVVLATGVELDEALEPRSAGGCASTARRATCPTASSRSPRCRARCPGKKLEVPVKKILMGGDPEQAASRDSLANPEALDYFVALGAAG